MIHCKKTLLAAVAGLVLLAFACGCMSTNEPPPGSGSSLADGTGTILAEMETLYQQLDSRRIPTKAANVYEFKNEVTPGDLPTQFILDEPVAYQLAQQIRSVLYPSPVLGNFDNVVGADHYGLLLTALYHSPALDFQYSYDNQGVLTVPDYPDHQVGYVMQDALNNDLLPAALYYADDVQTTVELLFGKDVPELVTRDAAPYFLYKREGLYVAAEMSDPLPYPQLLSYTVTDGHYVCEAVLLPFTDRDTPPEVEGVPVTAENFAEVAATLPHYSYTFGWEGDRLILLAHHVVS